MDTTSTRNGSATPSRDSLITDTETLRAICGDPHPLTPLKVQTRLTEQAQDFIKRSPFLMLATANAQGEPTVSPKGDKPGFVWAEDEFTLHLPDRKGNRLLFSLQNVLENPNVGMIFLLPGTNETLRVHGTAKLSTDPALCQRLSLGDHPAQLVMTVRITHCYFHCSRSLHHGGVWQPESWPGETMPISFKSEIQANTEA